MPYSRRVWSRSLGVGFAVLILVWSFCGSVAHAQSGDSPPALAAADASAAMAEPPTPSFVARNSSLSSVFRAIQGKIGRPIVVSEKVQALAVSGIFDLRDPLATMKHVVREMGLMTFDDGHAIFVYLNAELKGEVVHMAHGNLGELRNFLQASGLYDELNPIRGGSDAAVFYVSGTPMYVRLVIAATRYLESMRASDDDGAFVFRLVPLHNTFVSARQYMIRNKPVTVPGVEMMLHELFSAGSPNKAQNSVGEKGRGNDKSDTTSGGAKTNLLGLPLPGGFGEMADTPPGGPANLPMGESESVWDVRMVANPDANSIMLYGPRPHVDLMQRVIESMDVEKRQIELSLWIVDVNRQKLDELGVDWQTNGRVTAGAGQVATLNSITFLASVSALAEKGYATIVSRPIVLTEENSPALFDSNHTEYYPLVGERTSALEQFTYGTMVNVLPRLTKDAQAIEMIVTVQDGRAQGGGDFTANSAHPIPVVSDTQISTVALVPRTKSLLLGGSTLDHDEITTYYVPGLWRLPYLGGIFRLTRKNTEHMVRLFLIQPKVLDQNDGWLSGQSLDAANFDENSHLAATNKLLQKYMEQVDVDDR